MLLFIPKFRFANVAIEDCSKEDLIFALSFLLLNGDEGEETSLRLMNARTADFA